MRWLALGAVLVACSHASAPRYPLHPDARLASGGPIEVRGAVANPGVIPYAPGITLTCALRLAGGPTALAFGHGQLIRRERGFSLPVSAIVDGAAPDLELAPGDVVILGEGD